MTKALLFCFSLFFSNLNFAQCNNLTDGGQIGYDQFGCGSYDPDPIVNVQTPQGGSGTIEYMWIKTYDPNNYTGADAVPGANSITYDPPTISQTTWFVRCARRQGCDQWLGESIVCMYVSNMSVTVDVEDIGCGSTSGGIIDFDVSNGIAPINYFINGNPANNYNTGLASGVYDVQVEDASGCIWTDQVEILFNDLDVTIDQVDDPCGSVGDFAQAVVTGGFPPYSYSWSNGSTNSYLDGNTEVLAGTYTVYASDSEGCEVSYSVEFIDGSEAKAEILCCQDTVICEGGTASIDISLEGIPPYSITWMECGEIYSDTTSDSIYTITTSPNEVCEIKLISVVTGCGEANTCGKATIAVQDCDPSACLSGCFYSSIDQIQQNGNCIDYSIYITSTGCATELSNLVISIPCGSISNLWNSEGYDMYTNNNPDPNSGLVGIKIDDISNFYPGAYMKVKFTLCQVGCELDPTCLPIIGYKAGNCVLYEETIPMESIYKMYNNEAEMFAAPNPFDDQVFISMKYGNFDPLHGQGEAHILDPSGRLIKSFEFTQVSQAGDVIAWDGTDENGNEVNAGVYFFYYKIKHYKIRNVIRLVKMPDR